MKCLRLILLAFPLLFAPPASSQQPCADSSLIDPLAFCPAVFDPVCGCDGKFYENSCVAQKKGGVASWTPGPCTPLQDSCTSFCYLDIQYSLSGLHLKAWLAPGFRPAPVPDSIQWGFSDSSWVYTGKEFEYDFQDTGRKILCAYYTGVTGGSCSSCKVLNIKANCVDPGLIDTTVGCFAIYDPVCGCDGQTYENECVAYNHYGVTSWTKGACPMFCVDSSQLNQNPCPLDVYDPVCGCDGKTYGSPCEAQNFGGIRSWTKGVCCLPECKALFSVSILPNRTVVLRDYSYSAETWSLDFGDTQYHGGYFDSLTHVYSHPGIYTICLEISNFAGSCTDLFCQTVNLTTSGTSEPRERPVLTVFPNPVRNRLHVEVAGAEPRRLTLYDLNGKKVFETPMVAPEMVVNIRDLRPGSYLLRVQTAHGVLTQRIVIAE